MSLVACACYVLCCDGCGASLADDGVELHFTDADPAGQSLVEVAEESGWHCGDCPRLASVCEPCRAGQHALCKDPGCTCALQAPPPGQAHPAVRGEVPDA